MSDKVKEENEIIEEEKFPEEELPEEIEEDFGGEEFTFKTDDFYPFRIDFINRKLSVVKGVNIGVSTRKFLKLRPEFLLSGTLEADGTVVSVTGAVGETTLNSYTIPLNTISRNYAGAATSSGPKDYFKAGNVFRIWAAGVYTTDDATATVNIALKVGSTTYQTITTTAIIVTNVPWFIDWKIIINTIGSSGTAESFVHAQTNNVNKDVGSTSTFTIDTTANQVISLTATWVSGSAGDTISIRQFLVELLN